jgi:signal peptidase I
VFDRVQFIDANLYLNNSEIIKSNILAYKITKCGNRIINVLRFEEKLPNGKKFHTVYLKDYTYQNSDVFEVPQDHYFFLGDNRDCSKDSRFLSEVGYVHKNNLVGKAQILFFSSDQFVGSIVKFWNWNEILRFKRFFKFIN